MCPDQDIVELIAACATLDERTFVPATVRERAALAWARALACMTKQEVLDERRREVSAVLSDRELSDIAEAVARSRGWARLDTKDLAEHRAFRRAEAITVGLAIAVAVLLLLTSTAVLTAAP